MNVIAAGETFKGSCSNEGVASLSKGSLLPSPERAVAKVIAVDGKNFELGPMKAGDILINVPCGDTFESVSFTVQELPPEAAMNRYSPLGTEKVEYPITLYILIALVLLSPFMLFYFLKLRRKKAQNISAASVTIKKSPRENLEAEILFLESNVKLPESHHFHSLYKKLRKFIEKELNLSTRSLTTKEFLATFRALALQQSTNQNLIAQLEYILITADDVRFAGKAFTAELWKDYLIKTKAILAAFPKKIEEQKKKK